MKRHLFRSSQNIQYRSTLHWFTFKEKHYFLIFGFTPNTLLEKIFLQSVSHLDKLDSIQHQTCIILHVSKSLFFETPLHNKVSNKVNNPSNFSNLIDTIPEHRSMYSIAGWELTLPECNRVSAIITKSRERLNGGSPVQDQCETRLSGVFASKVFHRGCYITDVCLIYYLPWKGWEGDARARQICIPIRIRTSGHWLFHRF